VVVVLRTVETVHNIEASKLILTLTLRIRNQLPGAPDVPRLDIMPYYPGRGIRSRRSGWGHICSRDRRSHLHPCMCSSEGLQRNQLYPLAQSAWGRRSDSSKRMGLLAEQLSTEMHQSGFRLTRDRINQPGIFHEKE